MHNLFTIITSHYINQSIKEKKSVIGIAIFILVIQIQIQVIVIMIMLDL